MPRTKVAPAFLELQRRQLDAALVDMRVITTPRAGWIRTVRQALGMTLAQFGKRLGMSPQGAVELERRERDGSVTVGRLSAAATALGCELKLVFVPRTSLEDSVRAQATAKARADRNRLLHTMRLEAQGEGVDDVLDEEKAVEDWLTARAARLWD